MSLKEGDWTKIGVVHYDKDKKACMYKEFDVVCHIIKDNLYYDFREQQFGRYSIKHANLYKILKPQDDTDEWIYTFCETDNVSKATATLLKSIEAKKESLQAFISYFDNIKQNIMDSACLEET